MVESAIIAKPCPVLGERVHAVIVTGHRGDVAESALRAWCAERLSDYKVPETMDLDDGAIAPQRQWQGDEKRQLREAWAAAQS